MNIDLGGRTALVSGSTQGIGLAIATQLARSGARVAVNGRDEARTEAAAETVRAEAPGAEVLAVPADLATAEGAAAALEQVRAVAEIDILVNNLGIFGPRPALEITDDEWRRYFEVNVLSAVRLIRECMPGMIERGWGRILSLGSDSAVMTPAEMIHYGMTKTALLSVSRGFAKAAKGTGVTVNTVMAGPTHTAGVEGFVAELVGDDVPWDEAQARFMAEHRPHSLIGRLIEPREIGDMVVYLSSEQASATTGGAIRVDGGYTDSILP